jgi:hypothetical protein
MSKNEYPFHVSAIILMMVILSAILSGCVLNRWLPFESGVYKPLPNAAAGSIMSIEVDRENHLAMFHLADGSRIIVSFSSRARKDWPSGCPTNIGSTHMEVLDIVEKSLSIAGLTFTDPILVRDCPSDPERIALREDGLVGGGNACAGLDKCLSFGRQSKVTPELTAPIFNAKPLPSSMKGYELYSWHDEEGDSWRYTLITGTNRLKTVEEIMAEENQVTESEWVKITASGTEALKALLRRLPPGTELSWLDGERLEGARELIAIVMLPEAGVVEAIENHCRQLDIQLHVSQ